jgi:hypothetical protein
LEAFAQQQQKSKCKQIVHDANIINISFYIHSLYAVNSIVLKVMLLLEIMGDLRSREWQDSGHERPDAGTSGTDYTRHV